MCHRCPLGLEHATCTNACLETSFELLGHRLDNVAAVIVESVVSAGGMIFPPKDYLQALHAKTKAAGALFIVDEAQTGFGRCGRWFDIEHYDIQPDIIVVSKTAGNGYPAAAVVVCDEVAQKLEQSNFMHLSSHQKQRRLSSPSSTRWKRKTSSSTATRSAAISWRSCVRSRPHTRWSTTSAVEG
jgi:4-aminobutyrate aminotransferase-like enzyme